MSQYKQDFKPGFYLIILPNKEIEINIKELFSVTNSGAMKIIDINDNEYLISKSNFIAIIPSMLTEESDYSNSLGEDELFEKRAEEVGEK